MQHKTVTRLTKFVYRGLSLLVVISAPDRDARDVYIKASSRANFRHQSHANKSSRPARRASNCAFSDSRTSFS
eukprot:scaffold156532_cov22-Tisochrysis_lutea.AAC.1